MDSSPTIQRMTHTVLLADPSRPEAVEASRQIEHVLEELQIPCVSGSLEDSEPIPSDPKPDVAIVIGGDGTMIAQARRLVDHSIPMIGVNCGRLGFLAPFSPASFKKHARTVLGSNRTLEHRMLMEVRIEPADGGDTMTHRAMNDGLITAGEPFRMIQMSTSIDGQEGPKLSGDGLVIATPTGSTGHNASSGGPIVDPRLDAIIFTPLAAQSLAFRPCALHGQSTLEVVLEEVNVGTSLVLDGQNHIPLRRNDRVAFSRYPTLMGFVACPGHPFLRILHDKLGWAAPPRGSDVESS